LTESSSSPLRLFLIACEESGDRLGGALMRALRAASPRAIEFIGVGGGDMAEQGLTTLFPIDDLAIVGFNAVFARLPLLVRRINETTAAVLRERPDGLIIIDSPDFTHRVARRVRKAAPEIPIVDYVSPSVWAWRPGRARAMQRYVDHLLALLPFEPDAHKRLGGPPCTYVGHPLTEAVADLRPDERERARRNADPPVLLVLPGSRSSEIARHLDLIGETVQLLETRCGPLELVLPTVPAVRAKVEQGAARWQVAPKIVIEPADKWRAFRTARAALAVSGTVTLELALAGVPSVVIYRVSLFEDRLGQSGAGRERDAGTPAARRDARAARGRSCAAAWPNAGARASGRRLRPTRSHHGDRPSLTERACRRDRTADRGGEERVVSCPGRCAPLRKSFRIFGYFGRALQQQA
jgi:lipid-A-disaccharide synthase